MTRPAGLVVVSHKPCVIDTAHGDRILTDGGFPAQMRALARRFGGATILVPCTRARAPTGLTRLDEDGVRVVPLTPVRGRGILRKLLFPLWCARNARPLIGWMRRASGVHAVIPGDVGTVGLWGALRLERPLLVRHCGNWATPRTRAERHWKSFMERHAGGRTACFATGGGSEPPSAENPHVRWIFSSSLSQAELEECHARGRRRGHSVGRLVLVARQEPGKGTDITLVALEQLVARGHDLRLTVVGDGSALQGYREKAAALGLESRVDFVGRVRQVEVLAHLEAADLFVYPTRSEGFPKAVLEALAMGRPVVTTKVSVLPHLLRNGGGVLLPERTPEAVADAVATLYEEPERLEAMRAEAMQVSDAYSLEAWAERMHEAMERAIRSEA